MLTNEEQTCLEVLERTAVNGARTPENGTFGVSSHLVSALARKGILRIEISGHNYRTIVFLKGYHAGKSTKPDPSGAKPWKIIDATGTRRPDGTLMIRTMHTYGRAQPSPPTLLRRPG